MNQIKKRWFIAFKSRFKNRVLKKAISYIVNSLIQETKNVFSISLSLLYLGRTNLNLDILHSLGFVSVIWFRNTQMNTVHHDQAS